jgi:flavin reductase
VPTVSAPQDTQVPSGGPDPTSAAPVFSSRELRHSLGAFATGVTVITTAGEAGPHGLTANAFSSLSLDPPQVLVCVVQGSASAKALQTNGVFAVNILAADQEPISRYFASKDRPRGPAAFAEVAHATLVSGSPILDGVCGFLDCRVIADHPGGDHRILVGEVLAIGRSEDRDPLIFHGGGYRQLRGS